VLGGGLNTFQYLKGAIGRISKTHSLARTGQFQYLKGAIGSGRAVSGEDRLVLFQYLKGAIGRTANPTLAR